MKRSLLAFLAIAALAACTTEVRQTREKRKVIWDYQSGGAVSVDEIEQRLKDEPDNPQPYFLMGMHYESVNQLVKAIEMYLQGMERFENLDLPDAAGNKKDGFKFTGGHYRVGRCYARLRAYNKAIVHLGLVLKLEPKDLPSAMANPHFRETHFLVGACYNEVLKYKKAREHFVRFVELGGEEWRVADLIFRIDQTLKAEAESGSKSEARDPLEAKKG